MLNLYVKLLNKIQDLKEAEDGATIIEYSLLIGLLTVAVVATVILVGSWIALKWTALMTAVNLA